MTTKLVRLTAGALDAIRLHDPEHSPSQGILEMHRKLTLGIPQGDIGIPPVNPTGIQKVNLSDDDWEQMENLIKVTVKIAVKEAIEDIPNKLELKKEDNQFHTPKLSKGGSPLEGTETVNGVPMKWRLDPVKGKIWEKA